ncbi:hypothetical protein H0H92_012627 [Tricholoma furcatifolium]|nr:hypothetical protein H0H92_011360 [Tricholoma furcatifolium]KAG6827246.1 hypothetical protein H0H92_012627 [Tricholoma furcatifolium]
MSDEYAQSGYKGSLVNPTVDEAPTKKQQASAGGRQLQPSSAAQIAQSQSDYQTHNYPSPGDTTAEGGYSSSSNVWSGRAQRGNKTGTGTYQSDSDQVRNAGLTDIGKDGEPLRDQYDDYGVGWRIPTSTSDAERSSQD